MEDFSDDEWLIPAGTELTKDMEPAVIWEYARESFTLCSMARDLKELLKSEPTGIVLDEDKIGVLIREARASGFHYTDFIYPEFEPESHA